MLVWRPPVDSAGVSEGRVKDLLLSLKARPGREAVEVEVGLEDKTACYD